MNAKLFVSQRFDRSEKGDSAPFFAALATDVVWTAKGFTPTIGYFDTALVGWLLADARPTALS